jgi:glycine oxidase
LQALLAACRRRGVVVERSVAVLDVATAEGKVVTLTTTQGIRAAEQYCFCAGAWTYGLLHRLGLQTGILPIRGQMVLFRAPAPPFARVLNAGSRYLVPRDDGRVLAGSTEEEVGFDKSTTPEAIQELKEFACEVVPALRDAEVERTWAGLRPGSFDGFPYLGAVPGLHNAFVAAGHFRSGVLLSTGTAVVLGQLMRGEIPAVDLAPFRVGRG